MQKTKYITSMLGLLSASILLGSCAVRKEAVIGVDVENTDSSVEELAISLDGASTVKEANIYRMQTPGVKLDGLLQAFFGLSAEEMKKYYYRSAFETNGITVTAAMKDGSFSNGDSEDEIVRVSLWDENEGAYSCYSVVTPPSYDCLSPAEGRNHFPEEELDDCTREEAMEACRPYAEACGYTEENSEIQTYAVTLDILEAGAKVNDYGTSTDTYYSAPNPDYEVVYYRDIWKLQEEGKEEEAEELQSRKNDVIDSEIPWEKKHEAMILVYYPCIEGVPVVRDGYLIMIYVPLYGKPVWVEGTTFCEATELRSEAQPLVTQEEAFAAALQSRGRVSRAVELQEVRFVYALQGIREERNAESQAIPCWQVIWKRSGKLEEVLIDAVYGDEYIRYPEL